MKQKGMFFLAAALVFCAGFTSLAAGKEAGKGESVEIGVYAKYETVEAPPTPEETTPEETTPEETTPEETTPEEPGVSTGDRSLIWWWSGAFGAAGLMLALVLAQRLKEN